MEKKGEEKYVKRTQNDYSLPFKLQVIEEVEKGELTYKQAQLKYGIQGRSTVLVWLRKHGRLDWKKSRSMKSRKIPQERIRELEREIKHIKGDKEILEIALDVEKEELGIDIRKMYLAKLSADQKKKDTR